MLGMRGCRLGIQHPSVTAMQSRAIFEAAKACADKGIRVKPQIMVPLVATAAEFSHQANVIRDVHAEVFAGVEAFPFEVGVMVETPRAALVADKLVRAGAQFLSLGTNDLTQMTLGYSRDDVGSFLPAYLEQGVLPADPFQVFDEEGVGQLVAMATSAGRAANDALKVGVCGEHGGEPASIDFFHRTGLDYVSCSPLRVPIARLAAAQAALGKEIASQA